MGSPETKKEKPWLLRIGCHRKTITSRDMDERRYDTLKECEEDVARSEKGWATMGYYVWYANAVGPDGKEHRLHEGTSCS